MKFYKLLGLKPEQKFRIKDNTIKSDLEFMFNLKDELVFYSEVTNCFYTADKKIIVDLIHYPELIEIVEEESITKENVNKEDIKKNK